MKNILKIKFLLLIISLLMSCSSTTKNVKPKRITDFRAALPETSSKNIILERQKYQDLVAIKGGLNSSRLVEIFDRSKKSDEQVEYRILDVREDSVYEMLGIENLDIIVAASGYIVPSQTSFWQYLLLLGKLEEGSIEVRRKGKPLLLNYKFQESA